MKTTLIRTALVLGFGLIGGLLGLAGGMVVWAALLPGCPVGVRDASCDGPTTIATMLNLFTSMPLGLLAGAVIGNRVGSRLTLR